ncbi:hypothetical protein [Mangrovicoccus algicola]|uniref:hypothetical protein n=1 Tax=Mangrovicoccus algicola TaxID=2771008 RepID=UPI001D035DFB|nr:hypothetical protein [Mangrovicoccus algicola]
MIKIVTLFLIGMAVLAMFGKLRLPRRPKSLGAPRRCPHCNSFLIGRSGCNCDQGEK